MKTELKPCPFCGGEAKIMISVLSYVMCDKCCAETNHYITEKEAIEAWNRRTEATDE